MGEDVVNNIKPKKPRKLKGYLIRFLQSYLELKAFENLGVVSAFRLASHDRSPAALRRAFKSAGVRKIDFGYIPQALQLAKHWLEHGEYDPALMRRLRPNMQRARNNAERVLNVLQKIDKPKKRNPPETVFSRAWTRVSPLTLTLLFLSSSATEDDRKLLQGFIDAQQQACKAPSHGAGQLFKRPRRVVRRSWGVTY